MITDRILRGDKVILRQIELSDCSQKYVAWLNDADVSRYLETKWTVQTQLSVEQFVKAQRENDHSILFAVIWREDRRHIGNIKIGPVNRHHLHADISYFIGEKGMWGRGAATEAIALVCGFGFHDLGLHRIEAGAYACAVGSRRALEKNNFREEARFREHIRLDGAFIDSCRYGLLESDYTGGA